MSESAKAVFLSYASQDAEAAKRICDALRAAGVEVWFDQSELVGGDQWDAKIRGQISSCALFVPLISANTQARLEGYFRREWKQAAARTHDMADEKAFLLPIVIDDTRDADAKVPAEFKAVQWTKLPGGESPPAFAARVQKLLSGEHGAGSTEHEIGVDSSKRTQNLKPRNENRRLSRLWWVPAIFGVTMALLLVLKERHPDASMPPPAAPVVSSEISALRAQLVPDRWQQEDYQAMAPRLDRIIRDDPDNADAWALRSIIESLQVTRNFDPGTKPLEAGKNDADRALRLAPQSPLANLAMGMHLVAMISRGGDAQACRPWIDRAVAALPAGPLTRYCDGVSHWLSYDFAESERQMHAWIEAEPHAGFPNWILAQLNMVARQPDQSEQFATEAARDDGITGIRARYTLFESSYYLRADLARSREILQGIPANGSTVHRVVHARWLMAMAEGRWDDALQELARLPENFLFDRAFHGPKALLAGLAHARAGRADAANAQFRESERLLREHLAADPDNEELHAVLAVALACLGQADAARSELALVEPLVSGRAANVYRGSLVIQIAQARCLLGDYGAMATWVRKLFAEKSAFPFTPASFVLDPRFSGGLAAPEIRALLQEFAALATVPAPARADEKSVAVLAFANLSDDKNNEYFSDGISEELLNVLCQVPGLKVTARTSSFYFKGKEVPIPEIAQRLGVAYIIEGSVRKQGDKIRITAQLIKAADGFNVWSDTFTRELKDIFAVQDEIAGLVAQQLQLKLTASDQGRRVVDPEAYRLMLEGRQYWNLRTMDGFAKAEAAFSRAIELDPKFAQAHAGLADVLVTRAFFQAYGGVNQPDFATAREASRHALALDPKLAEAYPAAGVLLMWDGKWVEADAAFQRAFALNPNYALGHHWYSLLLELEGRLDVAEIEIDRAILLDPLSVSALSTRLRLRLWAGTYADGLVAAEQVRQVRPDVLSTGGERILCLLGLGRRDEAVAMARQLVAGDRVNVRWLQDAAVVHSLRQAGLESEAVAYATRLLPQLPPDSYVRGTVLAALGRWDEARPFLERTPSGLRSLFFWSPVWDGWREDPRFRQLLAKLGATDEYRVARETLARMAGKTNR